MTKLRIICDIDSTICDTLPRWLEVINHHTKVGAKVEDITQWYIENCSPLNKLSPNDLFRHLDDGWFMESIPLIPRADKALKKLMEDGHEVFLVTARLNDVATSSTLAWVRGHLPFLNKDQVVFCSDKSLIEADVIIDDKPSTLIKYHTLYPRALLMTLRWPYTSFPGIPEGTVKIIDGYPDYSITWGTIYGYIKSYAENKEW